MDKICVINGPNLNLLGTRQPEIYGTTTLKEVNEMISKEAEKMGIKTDFFQSNHEGEIIDKIHSLIDKGFSGIIINPGAFTHYSYAIRDAISSTDIKTVEIHLSDISQREEFRKISVIKDVCINQIKGHGPKGYIMALETLKKSI